MTRRPEFISAVRRAVHPLAFAAAVLGVLAETGAGSARTRVVEPSVEIAAARAHKRPLMRPGRVQYCLKKAGRYEGRINGRMTTTTARAMRRFGDDLEFEEGKTGGPWALHALLWRQCREAWLHDGGSLDRFGLPEPRPRGPSLRPASAVRSQEVSSAAAMPDAAMPASPVPTQTKSGGSGLCLPAELRDILARARGAAPEIPLCDLPCLPMPSAIDRDDARAYERRLGFSWCKSCVAVGGELSLDDIARIEKTGGMTLCPQPRRIQRVATQPSVMVDSLRGTRALFRRDVHAGESHAGIAVVISVSSYRQGRPRPQAERDGAGMQALLTERLGFRANRVLELKNPTRAEIEDVFGGASSVKGLLSDRLKGASESPILVYFSGRGALDDGEGEAYLLPADGEPGRARTTGYPLSVLYQNLARIGSGPVTVVLEADFATDADALVVAPNGPTTQVMVLPRAPAKNLTVFAAADRDQRPLEDRDSGMSLFTRYLIEGLSGHADVAPLGNGDGGVDTAEAFVYAASHTALAARKLSGVLQRPLLSQSKPVAIGRLGPPLR